MKITIVKLVFIVFLLIGDVSLFSQKLSTSYLKEFTRKFFEANEIKVDTALLTLKYFDNKKSIYIVENNLGGWLLLANTLKVEPVVGYSMYGKFNKNESLLNFLNYRSKQLDEIKNSLKSEADLWENYISKNSLKSESSVNPIIKVEWDQGAGWNKYCPEDSKGPGGRVYVGCVAVATAQAMSVYSYPEKGEGNHSHYLDKYGSFDVNFGNTIYNWSEMSEDSPDDYNTLVMYQAAVALNMQFSPNGSGAYTSDVPEIMEKYFKYDTDCRYLNRNSYATDVWHTTLKEELKSGRPIIYSGNEGEKMGHCFNIDGYDNMGLYHVNWGWSGSGNGYYSIDALNYNGKFNDNQGAVINIKPFDHSIIEIQITNLEIEEKNSDNQYLGRIIISDKSKDDKHKILLIATKDDEELPLRLSNDSIFVTRELNYSSEPEIDFMIRVQDLQENSLDSVFTLKVIEFDEPPYVSSPINRMSLFSNQEKEVIKLTDHYSDPDNDDSLISYKLEGNKTNKVVGQYIKDKKLNLIIRDIGVDTSIVKITSNGKSISDTIYINVDKYTSVSDNEIVNFVYPNPFRDKLYVCENSNRENYYIYDMNGVLIIDGRINNGVISTEELKPGIYIIKLMDSSGEVISQRITKY